MGKAAMDLALRWWKAEGEPGRPTKAYIEDDRFVVHWRQPGVLAGPDGPLDNKGVVRLSLDELMHRLDNPR